MSNPKSVDASRAWFLNFFRENRQASLDRAEKAANHARVPLLKMEVIRELRRQARREKFQFNAPRLVVASAPETHAPVECAACGGPKTPEHTTDVCDQERRERFPSPADVPESSMSTEAIAERRKYLNDLAEQDPSIEPLDAVKKVREKFGIGLSSSYAYETVRLAREVAIANGATHLKPVFTRRPALKVPGDPLVVAIPGAPVPCLSRSLLRRLPLQRSRLPRPRLRRCGC